MLGERIHDPDGIEGPQGSSAGLGLLAMQTTLETRKQLALRQGRLSIDAAAVQGYEIHMGISRGDALQRPLLQFADGGSDGAISADGQVAGSYLHGLFDHAEARQALLGWSGMAADHRGHAASDYQALIEDGIDRLADSVEQALDMAVILDAVAAGRRRSAVSL
jgi:adenosylcobyric acid synthase